MSLDAAETADGIKKHLLERLINGLSQMAKAFEVYDRALFYYNGPLDDPEVADTTLTYKQYLSELPGNGTISEAIDEGLLALSSHELLENILNVYVEAGKALAHRYEEVANEHKHWCNAVQERRKWPMRLFFGRRKFAVDRSPDVATVITFKSISEYKALCVKLDELIVSNADREVWCPYLSEFLVLEDKCKLLTDEISFLGERVNTLQGICAQRTNENSAFWGIFVGLIALVVSMGFEIIGLGVEIWGGRDDEIVQRLETIDANTAAISRDVERLSDRVLLLVSSTNQSKPPLPDRTPELLAAFAELKEAFTSKAGTITAEVRGSCERIEQTLQDLANDIKNMPRPPVPNEQPPNAAILKEIEALRASVEVLKNSVDSIKPTEINIHTDDHSRRKHGFFNWF